MSRKGFFLIKDFQPSSDLGPKIEMNVIDIEPLGPHTLLIVDVDGGKFTTQFAKIDSKRRINE